MVKSLSADKLEKMTLNKNAQNKLLDYIKNKEVVYQGYGELIEVSNEDNVLNKERLLRDFNLASSVEVYYKGDNFIHEPFLDLDEWATDKDVFFLLEVIGTLICIPKEYAINHNILEAC